MKRPRLSTATESAVPLTPEAEPLDPYQEACRSLNFELGTRFDQAKTVDWSKDRPARLWHKDYPGAEIRVNKVGIAWELFCQFPDGQRTDVTDEHGVTISRYRILLAHRKGFGWSLSGSVTYAPAEGREADMAAYFRADIGPRDVVRVDLEPGDTAAAEGILGFSKGLRRLR